MKKRDGWMAAGGALIVLIVLALAVTAMLWKKGGQLTVDLKHGISFHRDRVATESVFGRFKSASFGALIEHHGPGVMENDSDDPDAPESRGGNPPSYEAIRTLKSLYVEYADGTHEYHNRIHDLDELRNKFSSLPKGTAKSLHAQVVALHGCRTAQSCWQSANPTPINAQK